ncbi:PREDICTED: transcription factor bHLH51-like [Ipomoea nil]|uniref:transcription factor bHLH51-like n=1 Tax=Ipomoea nil TaxID=35883 RepID=UPI000901E79F|nr:PREDICTED: transcription factor bHLH51-like [Ipomoea nil]
MENSFSGEWPEKGHGGGSASFPWSFPSDYSSAAAAAAFLSWPAQPFEEAADDRALSASKSHSEAEKRRRDRINAQLATLRKLIPKSEKMDKAALLSSVVDHVKDLKRKATEITEALVDVPTDTDEVTIDDQHSTTAGAAINDDQASTSSSPYLKASVCCDDRPELFAEINRALKDLRLTTVQADVTSLGGRVKSVFVLQLCSDDMDAAGETSNDHMMMNSVKHSLKVALCKIAIPASTTSYRIKSKRQRFFLPAHYHH